MVKYIKVEILDGKICKVLNVKIYEKMPSMLKFAELWKLNAKVWRK